MHFTIFVDGWIKCLKSAQLEQHCHYQYQQLQDLVQQILSHFLKEGSV